MSLFPIPKVPGETRAAPGREEQPGEGARRTADPGPTRAAADTRLPARRPRPRQAVPASQPASRPFAHLGSASPHPCNTHDPPPTAQPEPTAVQQARPTQGARDALAPRLVPLGGDSYLLFGRSSCRRGLLILGLLLPLGAGSEPDWAWSDGRALSGTRLTLSQRVGVSPEGPRAGAVGRRGLVSAFPTSRAPELSARSSTFAFPRNGGNEVLTPAKIQGTKAGVWAQV